jgi:hypothetical protein
MAATGDSRSALDEAGSALSKASAAFEGYAPAQDRPPFGSYAALTAIFNLGLAGFLAGARHGAYSLPADMPAKDVALVGIATHKLSRLIAKEKVTSFARAPFRRYEGEGGPAELSEEPRGGGMRAVIGEFIGCPYCIALWISGGLSAGMALAPRETRFVTGVFSGLAISDFLQLAYAAGQDKATSKVTS